MTAVNPSPLPVPAERILEETRLKLALAREHAETLATFGITAEWLERLAADIDTAVAIPSLQMQRAELRELTVRKDDKLAECVRWARQMRMRFSIANNGKPLATTFPSKELTQSEKNESRLIALLPTLIQLARTYANQLATVGQTEATIAEGEQLLADLIATNQAQEEYSLARTSVTADRRAAYLKLYEAVNRINQIGQLVYADDPGTRRLFESNWNRGGSTPDSADADSDAADTAAN